MYASILTAAQARQARIVLGLSQGKVAAELSLNRSYLSQFENGRYLFPDGTLHQIRDFYESRDYSFSDGARTAANQLDPGSDTDPERWGDPCASEQTARILDGFVVPASMDDDEADALLTEYAENNQRIHALAAQPAPRSDFLGFDTGVDWPVCEQHTNEALRLMARNYSLIEQLHGHETIFPCRAITNGTIGEYAGAALTGMAPEENGGVEGEAG